jgi:hypothetical protein
VLLEYGGGGSGAAQALKLRFNNDSGNNYVHRYNADDAAETADNTQNGLVLGTSMVNLEPTDRKFVELYITNLAAQIKIVSGHTVLHGNFANGNPNRKELSGSWVNTSAQITRIDAIVAGGSTEFATGSELVVLGRD